MKYLLNKSLLSKPLLVVLSGVFTFILVSVSGVAAHAAPVVGFDPSNIIDNITFTNSTSMSPDQIQTFLNSEVPTCDTNGTQPATDFGRSDLTHAQYASQQIAAAQAAGKTTNWTLPPYTCLKTYTENGLSAAQILYNVAQQYQINPQVLIVTLQKEQGIVTDTWPLPVEYQKATNYGCPDSAPCDSQYYGFTNQVTWAAKLYHAVVTSSPTWYSPYTTGNNYVLWNVSSTGCGGSNVNIQNLATAALYDFTPYQPNQAALNAGYGTGDGCSAYGNRNFYLYFTSWFGSTQSNDTLNPHPDGTVVSFGGAAYLIQNGTLHHILTGTIFDSNSFQWQDVKAATIGDKNLTKSTDLNFIQPGTLYTGDSSGVYMTVSENGQWVKQLVSYNSFISLGYNWSQVHVIPANELPTGTSSTILTSSQHPDGTLIKDSQGVYLIDHGTRRYVSAAVFLSQRWSWNNILPETTADQALPIGANMLLKAGSVITDGVNIYIVQIPSSGPEIKRPIGPWSCYSNDYKYNTSSDLIQMSTGALPVATGSNVTC